MRRIRLYMLLNIGRVRLGLFKMRDWPIFCEITLILFRMLVRILIKYSDRQDFMKCLLKRRIVDSY